MNPSYFILMAFHLVGVLFNIRMLVSCFKDKAKYTVLQKGRPFMICQCILHLILLALNANEVTGTFGNEQVQQWCGGVQMMSVGYLMIFNILAMLAIEHHSIVGLKHALSPRVALLMFGIISCGILFFFIFPTAELCASYITFTVFCSLPMVLMLLLVWRSCTHVDHDTTNSSTETLSILMKSLMENKMVVFFSTLIAVCTICIIILDVIRLTVVTSFPQSDIKLFERVIYLYAMCFTVGITLPLHFKQIIECSGNEADEKVILV